MANENFAVNTLIIPMDTTYQNNGMFLSYGLVYGLLSVGIPVKWAINPAKAYNGTDFTASAVDVQTSAVISNHSYTGGPFIIDSAYYAQALTVITTWQSVNPDTKVHRATSPFTAPIAANLTRKPRIAVEEDNAKIIIKYLDAAKIPDSNGNAWPNTSPDILSPAEVGAGNLFSTSKTDPCRQIKYDIFLSPHTSDSTWTNATNAAELDLWLKIGGTLHATCHSISAIENIAGPFITASPGFSSFPNKGDEGTFKVDVPAFPSAQAVPTTNPQKLPGGSEQTWLHTSVTYLASTQVLAHFTDNNLQYDFMVAGSYKGGTGAGKIIYEGGHEYSTNLPYLGNIEAPYVRFLLDSIFLAVAKPRILLKATPTNIPSGSATTVTYTVVNDGGSNANGLDLSIVLPNFAVYNVGSAVDRLGNPLPPTSIVPGPLLGQTTLIWNIATLATHTATGTVVKFTAQVTPPATGVQSVGSITAHYSDGYNESFTVPNYCASVTATPGAAPVITKTPVDQAVTPNSTFIWTINYGNNGNIALLNSVITDIIPAGLTFISSVPLPATGPTTLPDGSTQLTWGPYTIPATTPNFGTITITAKAPPATIASFLNSATVTGNDINGVPYSETASAEVDVVDRPPTVTLTAPLVGPICPPSTNISWTASDPDGDTLTYTLQYSADSGTTWTSIVTGLTGVCPCSYAWSTGVLPSGTQYRIKVIASDGLLSSESVSLSDLTIDNTPPTISWVTPTTGSLLTATPVPLQVSATDTLSGVQNVEFLYSQDGITFTSIGFSNTAPYTVNWEISGLPSGAYILGAIATDHCGNKAQSNINVTVNLPPTVTLTYPNGGEIICPPGTTITWTASDPNPNTTLTFTLYYSANGGSTYTQIATGLPGPCPCSYLWNTTGLPSGNNYRIKVVASDGTLTTEDASNAPFTVDNTLPTVSWVSPLNGALLTTSPVTLQASATDNIGINSVQFQYSTDGITFTNIGPPVTVPSSGSIYSTSWNYSVLSGGAYTLRAVAADKPCNNTNHTDINITATLPPALTITSPKLGDIVCPPGTNITWTASSPLGRPLTFTLQYSATGGAPFTTIATAVSGPCPCSYPWNTTGLTSGSNYVVKIIASDGIVTTEQVTGVFTIDNSPPSISWVNPTNGAVVTTSPINLQALATDNIGIASVTFQYSADDITYTNIATLSPPAPGNIYSYSWNYSALPSGMYHLRAIATDTPCQQTKQSDITVTLTLPPTITVVSPNGGETICPQQGTNITWTALSPNGDPLNYSLIYSPDGGASYTIIVTGLTGVCSPVPCSYHWDTSALPSGTNYLIKVIASNGFVSAEDVSNGPFTIDNTPPTVVITAPVPGSYLHGTVTITATATDNIGIIGGVTFEYSNDNGVTYNLIGNVPTPLGGVYAINWNTTAVVNGKYKIRASASDNCNTTRTVIDVTVDNTPPTVAISSPPNNSTVSGMVPILVTAADNECLAKVELYIDGVLVHTETLGAVKTDEFIFNWDTNEFPEGSHTVRAVATDCAGLTAETTNTYIVDNLPDHFQQVLLACAPLTIPPQKPDVELILDCSITPIVNHINLFNTIDGTKVTVTGVVEIGVTYSAIDPYNPYNPYNSQEEHFAEFTVPFHAMILYPGLPLDAKVMPIIFIEHQQCHLLDPRTIKEDIVLFVGIKECTK